MAFGETKVYFDGSHYIAIPHTTRPSKKRYVKSEELVTVIQEEDGSITDVVEPSVSLEDNLTKNTENEQKKDENIEKTVKNQEKSEIIVKKLSKKQIFEELYLKYIDLSKREREKKIVDEMQKFFACKEYCESYVRMNFERKQRNLICRRIRMCRKANLANFNYFCTFTYDDKKHTEQSFKKALKTCFRHLCERKKWRYMGVWERAPETNRLHFHGLFNIPENSMPGQIVEVRDYDTKAHKMKITKQCSYFNDRFGRSDFEDINECENRVGNAISYLIKYIEKTGEKIVYSKGLPQYFLSDIMDEDIVTTIGQEDKKLLLFDDFTCIDEGELVGKVCPEVISRMRKCN